MYMYCSTADWRNSSYLVRQFSMISGAGRGGSTLRNDGYIGNTAFSTAAAAAADAAVEGRSYELL